MFILVHSKSRATSSLLRNLWGNPLSNHTLITYTTTKKVTLIPSRHTLFLANTPTLRLLILIPSRTHSQSQQTHKKLVQQSTRITLVTEDNLKSIQAESYSTHFDQSQTLSNLSSLKISKSVFKILLLKSVFLNIFKDVVCYQILTNS